jgi:acyl carrier protein
VEITKEKLIEKVKLILQDQLFFDEVNMTSKIVMDLNADSLDVVEIVMALEEEFEIDICDEDAERVVANENATVQDVVDYITSRVTLKPALVSE